MNDELRIPLSNKENISNKTNDITSSSTNVQYPSAKAVYDILQPIPISANTDLNDLTTTGLYYCADSDTTSTLSNCPVTGAFNLSVEYNGFQNNGIKQTLTKSDSTQATWQRTFETYLDTFYTSGWGLVYEDTGWKDVTFKSGFSHYDTSNNYRVRYRRVGKVVELRGSVKNANKLTANTDYVMATITDTTCRPDGWVTYVQQGSGINRLLITIRSDGEIVVNRYGTTAYSDIPASSWINVHTTFLVN